MDLFIFLFIFAVILFFMLVWKAYIYYKLSFEDLFISGDKAIPFTYDLKKKKIIFSKLSFVFNQSKALSFQNFIDQVISNNKNEVIFWFNNIWKLKNFQKKIIVEIKIKETSRNYELVFLSYFDDRNKIYCCLNLVNNSKILSMEEYVSLQNNNLLQENNFANFHNHFDLFLEKENNKLKLIKTRKRSALYFIRILNMEIFSKYYQGNARDLILKKILVILSKEFKSNENFCIYDSNEFLFLQKKLHSKKSINRFSKKTLNTINNSLLNYGIPLNIELGIGVETINLKNNGTCSFEKIISNAQIACNKAATDKELFHVFEEIDQKDFKSNTKKQLEIIERLENNSPFIVQKKVFNLSNNKLKMIQVSFLLEDETNILKNNSILEWYLSNNKLDKLKEQINKIFDPNKQYMITIPFGLLFKDIQKFINFVKGIFGENNGISISNYSFQDIHDLQVCIKELNKNNLKIGLTNFKFFYNSVSLINLLKLNYVFLNGDLVKEFYKKTDKIIIMKNLQLIAKEAKIEFVGDLTEIYSDTVMLSSLGVKYAKGNFFTKGKFSSVTANESKYINKNISQNSELKEQVNNEL